MDLNKLTQGQKIAAGSAIALFIVMFFKWYGVEGAGDFGDLSAWDAYDFIDLILLLTIVVAVGAAVLVATGTAINLPVSPGVLTTLLGGFSTLLILFRILAPPDIDTPIGDIDTTRSFWLFVGLILAGAITYGGWRTMEEEGSSFQDTADRLSSGGRGDGDSDPTRERPPSSGPPSSPPPPPPPPPPPTSGS
jgi:hypothetical protein